MTLPVALEKGEQLAKALARDRVQTQVIVSVMLVDALKFYGAIGGGDDHIDKGQRLDIVDAIVDNYAHLNLEEIALVFKKAKAGSMSKDDKVYGRLTPVVVMSWFAKYANSDERTGYWERENAKLQSAHHNNPLLELSASFTLKKEDGITQLATVDGVEIPEVEPPLMLAEVNPMYAEYLHREEQIKEISERLKQEQKEERAEKARVRVQDVEAKNRFIKYLDDNYYCVISKSDNELLADAMKGPLSNEALAKRYAWLCKKYQDVINEYDPTTGKAIDRNPTNKNFEKSHD